MLGGFAKKNTKLSNYQAILELYSSKQASKHFRSVFTIAKAGIGPILIFTNFRLHKRMIYNMLCGAKSSYMSLNIFKFVIVCACVGGVLYCQMLNSFKSQCKNYSQNITPDKILWEDFDDWDQLINYSEKQLQPKSTRL